MLLSLSVFAVIWALTYTLNLLDVNLFSFNYYLLEFGLIIFIYWLSFVINQRISVEKTQTPAHSQESLISQEEALAIMSTLNEKMETDKLYQNPKLTRELLAQAVQISSKKLSSILNQHLKQGFNDYINGFRVEEVKRQLQSNKLETQTILSIAQDAGFNSQATFQRVFKDSVGMTPRDFISQMQK